MSEDLFHNKKKNLFVGVMAAAYLLITLLSADFVLYDMSDAASWRYNLNVLFEWILGCSVSICVLIYLLTLKKEFRLKKWLLPIGFFISCLRSLIGFPAAVRIISQYPTSYTIILFVSTCLLAISFLLCFAGTFFDFEFLRLFKLGILLNISSFIVWQIFDTVFYILNGYFNAYGLAGLSIIALAELIILILFDIGLFLMTVNKEK